MGKTTKLDIYTQHDIDVINDNIDILMKEVDKIKQENFEPTIQEFRSVINEMKKFIQRKNRIVYGGSALNNLIAKKNPNDTFYGEYDRPDFEFYSPDPLNDVKELCDYLYSKDFKYVSSAQAMHGDTYKIYVNEMDAGDITYVPAFIYNKLPYIEQDGLKYIHPHFAYIDYLRMYTDPLMSFWRLQKAIPRGMLLLKNFPLEVGTDKIKYDVLSIKEENVIKDISKMFEKMNSIIHVGSYAVKFFTIDKESQLLPFEVNSVEYESDVNKIYNELSKKYNITVKEYWPYFQFWNRHIDFFCNGKLVLSIFNGNGKCIPYRKYEAGFIASFQYVLLHHLIKFYYFNNNKQDTSNIKNIIGEILRSRSNYLKKHNKTVMDDTLFREFQINCLGKALDPMRYAFVDMQTKLAQGKRIKWRYNPRTDFDLKLPDYSFDNTSGNIIKNSRLMTIKTDSSDVDTSDLSDSSSPQLNRTLEDSEVDTSQEDAQSASLVPPMVERSRVQSRARYALFDTPSSEKSFYTSEII